MTKYLLTNYRDINLWYHDTLFMLDTAYSLRKDINEKIDILSQTKLGDYSKITYYDDEIFINWYYQIYQIITRFTILAIQRK